LLALPEARDFGAEVWLVVEPRSGDTGLPGDSIEGDWRAGVVELPQRRDGSSACGL
jgi:hypothetical protein